MTTVTLDIDLNAGGHSFGPIKNLWTICSKCNLATQVWNLDAAKPSVYACTKADPLARAKSVYARATVAMVRAETADVEAASKLDSLSARRQTLLERLTSTQRELAEVEKAFTEAMGESAAAHNHYLGQRALSKSWAEKVRALEVDLVQPTGRVATPQGQEMTDATYASAAEAVAENPFLVKAKADIAALDAKTYSTEDIEAFIKDPKASKGHRFEAVGTTSMRCDLCMAFVAVDFMDNNGSALSPCPVKLAKE